MDIIVVLSLLWLLPAMVQCGIIRDSGRDEYPCRNYISDRISYLDCSERGLLDLPNNLNYEAQVLVLANNNFISFPAQLQNFLKVEVLDMSDNHLTEPLPTYILNWKTLRTLNLSNNNYDSWLNIDIDFNVNAIDLSKNKINHIDEDAFMRMKELHFLDLSENRITDLPVELFSHATKLETLILSRNYFVTMPTFQSSSLKNIYLSSCQILSLDVNSWTRMQSLIGIDLSINEIEYIPDNLASFSLQELNLSYNAISILTDYTFSSLPHLAVLDLRGNEFKEVWSTSHFASNPFLREIHVKGNRWSCEGFSVNLLLTYEYLTKEPPRIADIGSLICYTPSNVTQLTWQEAYIHTWHSAQSVDYYTLVAVMIGIIIGIVFTSFVCRGIMFLNKPQSPRPNSQPNESNGTTTQARVEGVVLRIPLREDEPPTYDEALLMPRLDSSFHSLPDFIDEDSHRNRMQRRSRSIGDLTDFRPRSDRRSIRRAVEIHIN